MTSMMENGSSGKLNASDEDVPRPSAQFTIWPKATDERSRHLAGHIDGAAGGWLSDSLVKRYGLRVGRCPVGSAGMVLSGVCMAGSRLASGHRDALLLLSLGYFCMDGTLPVAWAVCLDIGRKHAGAVGRGCRQRRRRRASNHGL
jgi:hypothetical protein